MEKFSKQNVFEEMIAKDNLSEDEILKYIDYPAYFELMDLPLPENRKQIIEKLNSELLIKRNSSGKWDITNLGAALFARKLSDFKLLQRKAVRVIQYKDKSRIETIREQEGIKGYASGFEGLIGYIDNLCQEMKLLKGFKKKIFPMYPELAVRELVANALIHQDFSIRANRTDG